MKLDLEETTRRFHNVYEQVAKEYGYKTREDTKELDFNSPNGMTMLKTVEVITTPYLEEIEKLNNELYKLEGEKSFNEYLLQERIDKAIDKIQYIIDYGFDYDGFNNVEDLKGLIDMLVKYAVESKNILRGEDKE